SLTLDPKDLDVYIKNVGEINTEIDSLYQKSVGTVYQPEVDTLRLLFNEKVQSFESIIDIKVRQSRRQVDQSALRALSETQETMLRDSLLMPKQEITTTTTTRTEAMDGNGEEGSSGGLFQRVFGSKKEKESSTIPVRSEVRKERTVAYDSAYFEKVDTLITTARKALQEAEAQRQQQSALLIGKELEMVAKDQMIYSQLRSIILKIKEIEDLV